MNKINLTDSIVDVAVKMSEGNPGAAIAIAEMITKGDEIDPQSFAGGLGAVLSLDTLGIYGTDIYILFNDKCGRDVRPMLLLLRAHQLGMFPEERLRELSKDQSRQIDISPEEWSEIDRKVCEQLEDFKRPEAA